MGTESHSSLHNIRKQLRFAGTLRRQAGAGKAKDGLVRLAIDSIWNRGELEMADTLFAREYVNHGGLIPDLVRGPDAIKFSVVLYRIAFPGFRILVDEVTEEPSAVVLRWVAHTNPSVKFTRNGKATQLRGITRFRLHAGMIAESWTAWDSNATVIHWGALKRKLTRTSVDDLTLWEFPRSTAQQTH